MRNFPSVAVLLQVMKVLFWLLELKKKKKKATLESISLIWIQIINIYKVSGHQTLLKEPWVEVVSHAVTNRTSAQLHRIASSVPLRC